MSKLQQKPKNKLKAKNVNKSPEKQRKSQDNAKNSSVKPFEKPRIVKSKPIAIPIPPTIKKIIHKSSAADSKLPGIQNFWSSEGKPDKKRPAAASDDEDVNKDKKKQRLTGADRYQRYIDEEDRIRKIEDELADPNIDPHTPEQFDRALMGDKNSSFMWIKYMAFHLETAETDKARNVANKAIASINFREEGELLNVWIALLNLELRYGTNETYEESLREAVQRNDPFKVYSRTLTVLLEMEKHDEATKIVDTLKKKFKPLPDMWVQVSEAYLRMGHEKIAKEMLPKSLLSLADKDHVEYMVKFALMSAKHNLHDFSQTIFEKILSSYNKRLPIWFTYINMITKNGQIEIARSLFERLLVVKFPMKKLKTIFQKYIEFEMQHGEAGNVSKIKKLAKNMLDQGNVSD